MGPWSKLLLTNPTYSRLFSTLEMSTCSFRSNVWTVLNMCLCLMWYNCYISTVLFNNNTWYFSFALGNHALCDCSNQRKFNHICWADPDSTCASVLMHLYPPLKFDTLQCGRVQEPKAALIKAWPGQHWTLISLLSTLPPPSISNKPTHLRIPRAWEDIWIADPIQIQKTELKNNFAIVSSESSWWNSSWNAQFEI